MSVIMRCPHLKAAEVQLIVAYHNNFSIRKEKKERTIIYYSTVKYLMLEPLQQNCPQSPISQREVVRTERSIS